MLQSYSTSLVFWQCGPSLRVTSEPRSFPLGPQKLQGPVLVWGGRTAGRTLRRTSHLLLALLLTGKHLGGGSKPTPTEDHLRSVGVKADIDSTLFHCLICIFKGHFLNLRIQVNMEKKAMWVEQVGDAKPKKLIYWSILTSSGVDTETQTEGEQTVMHTPGLTDLVFSYVYNKSAYITF